MLLYYIICHMVFDRSGVPFKVWLRVVKLGAFNSPWDPPTWETIPAATFVLVSPFQCWSHYGFLMLSCPLPLPRLLASPPPPGSYLSAVGPSIIWRTGSLSLAEASCTFRLSERNLMLSAWFGWPFPRAPIAPFNDGQALHLPFPPFSRHGPFNFHGTPNFAQPFSLKPCLYFKSAPLDCSLACLIQVWDSPLVVLRFFVTLLSWSMSGSADLRIATNSSYRSLRTTWNSLHFPTCYLQITFCSRTVDLLVHVVFGSVSGLTWSPGASCSGVV
jgi:hypothetical protein